MKNQNKTFINGGWHKLIAKAQKVGDGTGWFVYRNLYEPIEPKESAFRERVSIRLTESIPAEKSRHLIERDTNKNHSQRGTGLYFDGIEQTGFELYLT